MNPAPAARETPRAQPAANVQPESGRAESMRSEPGRSEPGRSESGRSESGRDEPTRDEPMRGDGHAELDESDYEAGEFEAGEFEAGEFEAGELDEERDIEQMAVRLLSRARQRIREQPLTAVTGAFIVGFAFGNGVPKFLARAGIAIGLRMVMQRVFDRAELFEHDQ